MLGKPQLTATGSCIWCLTLALNPLPSQKDEQGHGGLAPHTLNFDATVLCTNNIIKKHNQIYILQKEDLRK